MSDPPDDELLAATQRDGAMFEAVFDRYFVAIHRYQRHRIGAPAADDLAAETFARAFAARDRARTVDGSLRAWLYAIASNLVTDELRTRQRADRAEARVRSAMQAAFDPATAWAVDPTGRFERDADLTAAVLELRPEEREALLLLAWGELSHSEIAEATGVATATVRTRIHRARTTLRARLPPRRQPHREGPRPPEVRRLPRRRHDPHRRTRRTTARRRPAHSERARERTEYLVDADTSVPLQISTYTSGPGAPDAVTAPSAPAQPASSDLALSSRVTIERYERLPLDDRTASLFQVPEDPDAGSAAHPDKK